MSIATHWVLIGAGTAAAATSAAEEEALDGEFLDYLDTLEGEQEDWTWFSEKDDPAGDAPAAEETNR